MIDPITTMEEDTTMVAHIAMATTTTMVEDFIVVTTIMVDIDTTMVAVMQHNRDDMGTIAQEPTIIIETIGQDIIDQQPIIGHKTIIDQEITQETQTLDTIVQDSIAKG